MILERQMSEEERALVESRLTVYDSQYVKLTRCLDILVIRFTASLFFSVMLWIFLAWVYSFFSDTEIGFTSEFQRPVFICLIVSCAIYAIYLCIQWLYFVNKDKQCLKTKMEQGLVSEESYDVVSVKRFKSDIYQCIIYFLLTSESRILVLFDSYNQRYAPVKAILETGYQIRKSVKVIRLPQTWLTIKVELSGELLDLEEELFKMNRRLEFWPSDAGFCEVPWDSLETYFNTIDDKI